MIHGDFFHPEPGAQPERGRKPRPLIRMTAHLDEADIRQLKGKEARRDQSRVVEPLGDLVGLRLPDSTAATAEASTTLTAIAIGADKGGRLCRRPNPEPPHFGKDLGR